MLRQLLISSLLLVGGILYAQAPQTISGTIVDENNEPLSGAVIRLDGSRTGAVTDANGRFTIKNAQGKNLQISYVGRETLVVPLTAVQPGRVITLKSAENLLDDAIVTGYQTISKERATGSVST